MDTGWSKTCEPENIQNGMEVLTQFKRRVPRRFFSGVAELTAGKPSINIIGQTAELSCFGCFVQTSVSVPAGTKVRVKITHCGTEFVASGEVIYILSKKGIGIKFALPESKDGALLQVWLKEIMPERIRQPEVSDVLVTRFRR